MPATTTLSRKILVFPSPTPAGLKLEGHVSDVHFTVSHRQPKLIAIDKQPDNAAAQPLSQKTARYCWSCMDPPPMSRRNHSCNVAVQMQSCIRPLKAGSLCPAGPDAICASPPDQPPGLRRPDQHQSLGKLVCPILSSRLICPSHRVESIVIPCSSPL